MSLPSAAPFRRWVAIGDSFTEGVGDPDPGRPNGVRGWADRAAAVLAAADPDFGYANLAIRGRKLGPILTEQVEPALALEPDLVSVYAGANDVLRPRVDLDAIVGAYDAALGRLGSSGAQLVVFTAYDPGGAPVFGALRGRFATYNELVREVAEARGATLVDFWRMRAYRDQRMWAEDRMHMSSAGHQQMATAFLDALGVAHDLRPLPLEAPVAASGAQRRADAAAWLRRDAVPWVHRRLTGRSSGDALSPRWPSYARPEG